MIITFHERGYKSDYEQLESIVYKVLTKFLSFDILYELRLRIVIKKTMYEYGLCMPIGVLPYRKYDITIKKDEDIVKNLIHELIHVKQFATGEHVSRDNNFRELWMGEDFTGFEYEDLPWEIEAFELEETLYNLLGETNESGK